MDSRYQGKKTDRDFVKHPGESLAYTPSHLPSFSGSTSQLAPHIADVNATGVAVTGKLTAPLAITALVSTFGSSFPHGWNTGVLNAPQQIIIDFLNTSYTERFGRSPEKYQLTLLWSFTVSIYLVGGCIGAFCAGWLANILGRKRGLLVCHVFGFVSALLFGFSKMAVSFEMLIIARLVVGIGCGAGSGLVPMYLTEIAPVNIRGAMGVVHQLGLTCGIFVSMVIGIKEILGTEAHWHILLSLTAVPCLVSLIVLPWFPESPRYLYLNKKDKEGAEKALQRFRNLSDVSPDIEEMDLEVKQQEKEPKWSFRALFAAKPLRLPLILVCSLAMVQQLSGINFVFYYCTKVFTDAGIPTDYVQYATMGTGLINVLITLLSVPLIEKSGRRIALLGGMLTMLLSMVALTISLWYQESVTGLSYLCIVATLTFVIGFAIGLGSIPQFIPAELFKQGPRPPAMSIGGFLNWLCNFLVGMLFPTMLEAMGPLSFVVFMAMVIGFGVLIYFKLPETKNKSYEEIYRIFAGPQSDDAEELKVSAALLHPVQMSALDDANANKSI